MMLLEYYDQLMLWYTDEINSLLSHYQALRQEPGLRDLEIVYNLEVELRELIAEGRNQAERYEHAERAAPCKTWRDILYTWTNGWVTFK